MKKSINKIISIFILISIVISNLPLGAISAYVRPSVAVSKPSKSTVNAGGSVSYTIMYSDADEIYLSSSYVTLNGFSANISVSGNGDTRTITLSNVQGSNGNKSIVIKARSAENDSGYSYETPNSYSFNLVNNNVNNNVNSTDIIKPSIAVSSPSRTSVNVGGSISYTISFTDNVGISRVNTTSSYITLNGFSANISVVNNGNKSVVTLSNIQGTAGKKNISIKAGAAQDSTGNTTYAISNSTSFSILQKVNQSNTSVVKPSTNNKVNNNINKNNVNLVISSNIATIKASDVLKSTPKITSTCNDNSTVLGDINKDIKTFSAWLLSQKENVSYVSQNNYVAKNEEVTYAVDYYNGSEEQVKDVKIKLTIPYNVDVLEINSDGYIKTQTAEETVIEWDKKSIQSEARCRLYVKVKYLQNKVLENSDKISEMFYVNLKTQYNAENEISYLRQLFVDTNQNKNVTINKYLSALDNTNSIRPEDKITRAELAKLLVDSGVIELKQGNNDYKKYKDAEEIPMYARDAVSALYSQNIIETFTDSEFKPNNPIVRDEFFKIVAKASEYMSNGKLKVNEPTFIYKDIVDDDDKTLSDNIKYIMELIRQNIIPKSETDPDEYILRKDAVEVINALTFRGPYVKDLGKNTIKFADITKEDKYFYNIIGASSTYTYNYSNMLEQQILEIK